VHYKQCKLQRENVTQVAWIKSHLAKQGLTIKIKEDGEWSEGWKVMSVGTAQSEEFINDFTDLHKKHRKVTDI